jgi:hypothetical protein
MFCAPGLIFDGIEGVGSRFHVLRSRTRFGRYRGRRVPVSCFALTNSFWAVPRASSQVFMFCAPGHILGGTESVGSRFHVLRSQTHFGRYRGRWVSFLCFVLPDSFGVVPRALGPILMFCAPGLIFGGIEGAGSHFHVLHSQTRFGQYRGCRVHFSCYTLMDSIWVVSRAPCPDFMFCVPEPVWAVSGERGLVFMFCAPELVLDGTEGVGSGFHFLRS